MPEVIDCCKMNVCYYYEVRDYECILFDWDGTIGKSLDLWMNALKDTLNKNGYFFNDKEIGSDYELFRTRFSHIGNDTIDNIINEALLLSNDRIPMVELYAETFKTLTTLRENNKRLGVVTTSTHKQIDPLLEKHKMKQLFDAVICGDDVIQLKPHAEPIVAAMESLDAVKSQTVMVGDSDKDIVSAQNAGVDSILFYPPGHERFHDIQNLKNLEPTYIIQEFREIISIVN